MDNPIPDSLLVAASRLPCWTVGLTGRIQILPEPVVESGGFASGREPAPLSQTPMPPQRERPTEDAFGKYGVVILAVAAGAAAFILMNVLNKYFPFLK